MREKDALDYLRMLNARLLLKDVYGENGSTKAMDIAEGYLGNPENTPRHTYLIAAGLEMCVSDTNVTPTVGVVYLCPTTNRKYSAFTVELDDGEECWFAKINWETVKNKRSAIQRAIKADLSPFCEEPRVLDDIQSAGRFPHRGTSMLAFDDHIAYNWSRFLPDGYGKFIDLVKCCVSSAEEMNMEIDDKTGEVKATGAIYSVTRYGDNSINVFCEVAEDYTDRVDASSVIKSASKAVDKFNEITDDEVEASFSHLKLKQDCKGNKSVKLYILICDLSMKLYQMHQ